MSGRERTDFNFTASFESTIARYEQLGEGKRADGDAYIENSVEAHRHLDDRHDEAVEARQVRNG